MHGTFVRQRNCIVLILEMQRNKNTITCSAYVGNILLKKGGKEAQIFGGCSCILSLDNAPSAYSSIAILLLKGENVFACQPVAMTLGYKIVIMIQPSS